MLARLAIFLLACAPFTASLEAGMWDTVTNFFYKPSVTSKPEAIKVLIVQEKPEVILEVRGKYKIFDPNPKKNGQTDENNSPAVPEHISTRFLGKRKNIEALSSGLRWGEEFPGIYQLLIVPDDAKTTTFVDGVEYAGSLYVYDVEGKISIVNEVKLEDYLSSILAQQYKDPVYSEVLNAIAITARTNALYQAKNPRNKFWDVDSKQVAYEGISVIDSKSAIERAIKATRNMVMSKMGEYPETIVPFPAHWGMPIAQAEEMAKKGQHAAQILNKPFPNTTIKLLQ